jgi:hypothetical protein
MQETTNYDQFKKLIGNAPVNPEHLVSLISAIEDKNLLRHRPILVNEKMEVVDGQHRLEAAKRLGIPIFYIVAKDIGIHEIATLNSNQRNWKMEHYLHLFCEHVKNEEYIKFNRWLKENKLSFTQGVCFFIDERGIGKFRKEFKSGDFVFDEKLTHLADKFKIFLDKAVNCTRGVKRVWTQQGCVRAFVVFSSNKEVDLKRLYEQMEKYPFLVSPRPNKQLCLELLYEIYNYKRHIKVEA